MANSTVNKVVLGSETLLDLTGDTATAEDVAEGKTFHLASGAQAVGTASGGGTGVGVFYGTCATAAATAAKVVVCEEFTSSDLVEGTVINVKFTYAQTYNGAPTLNVNSTGAKNIKRVGTTNAARYEWLAGEVLQFVYDGSYWVLTDGGIATTTYYGVTKLSSATNSTSTALAATASAVKAAYDLANGKQATLVSGTNIKTINGESILGSGDLTVGGGGGGGYDLVINVTLSDDGSAVVSHDADYLECMAFVRAFASGQDVRAVAYCRYTTYDDEDETTYTADAFALPLLRAYTCSYGGQYETDGGWDLTFLAVTSITQSTVSGYKVSHVGARQLVVNATNDDPELGVSVDYSVL